MDFVLQAQKRLKKKFYLLQQRTAYMSPPKIDEKSSRIENCGQLHYLIAIVLQKEVTALSF
eukprot:UN17311